MTAPAETLLANLQMIEQITTAICRSKGMTPEEIEEFAAEFKLRLVEHDYAVIRAFRGQSSFATYIATVIARALLDHRVHLWGKWNASAEAKRLGEVAVDLERLLYRDDFSFDEAVTALSTRYSVTREELDALAARLPRRVKRRRIPLEASVATVEASHVFAFDRDSVAKQISAIVGAFIDELPAEDQAILRLRFDADMSVAQIARSLRFDLKSVYRRLSRRFREIRERLDAAGIHAADVAELVGRDTVLDFHFRTGVARPAAITAIEHGAVEPVEETHA